MEFMKLFEGDTLQSVNEQSYKSRAITDHIADEILKVVDALIRRPSIVEMLKSPIQEDMVK